MPNFKSTCGICKGFFLSSHALQSTYCGHVFHKNCLDGYILTRNDCPTCLLRLGQPPSHNLFLDLDELVVHSDEFEELSTKLLSAEQRNQQLLDQKAEIMDNYKKLIKQFADSEKSKQELEQQIRESNFSDEDFLDLQHQYTTTRETITNLKKTIEELTSDIEKKTNEFNMKCAEKSVTVSAGDNVIKTVLEQRLSYLSKQLSNEIANSTRLSIEKMKLESCINAIKNSEPPIPTATKANGNALNQKLDSYRSYYAIKNSKPPITTATKANENALNQKLDSNRSHMDNSLIIENFPPNLVFYPLKTLIIYLGQRIQLVIREQDICDVKIFDKNDYHQYYNECVALFVKFKNTDVKMSFLLKEDVLKRINPYTSSCILRQNVERFISLHRYAKQKLKNNGFVQVFCRDNKVYAKKQENSQPLQVLNERQADNLLKLHIQEMQALAGM